MIRQVAGFDPVRFGYDNLEEFVKAIPDVIVRFDSTRNITSVPGFSQLTPSVDALSVLVSIKRSPHIKLFSEIRFENSPENQKPD